MADEAEVLPFASAEEWEAWLRANHDSTPAGVWIKFARKASGIPTVTYMEALHAALCYGWIDGQARSFDERFYLQRFTPRRREVERARADGRWEAAYDGPKAATVPDDLRAALDANPAAAEFFAGLKGQNRYAILHRVQTARRPETRARRIETFVAMLARGETLHP